MDINELRKGIDKIDGELLRLFEERMRLCEAVAEYKRENNLPVFQKGREAEVISKIRSNASEELRDGAEVLFSNIMDISKCLQQGRLTDGTEFENPKRFIPKSALAVACQGVSGANSEAACRTLFGKETEIKFFRGFEDVFKAVGSGEMQYGIIPIQNSTAGSVNETYDLMRKYDFYIAAMIRTEIKHCLAAKKRVKLSEIECVYSHEQALAQCSEFLKKSMLEHKEYINTASSAKLVAESGDNIAAICSPDCAERYGLEMLADGIANVSPNYTRFICISREFYSTDDADIISVLVSIPNERNSLYRLLTKFSVSGANLSHIESRIIPGRNFEAEFYLDFEGNIRDSATLLSQLKDEAGSFKFLGNYREVQ